MTDSKESVINIDDKEYSLDDLDDNQRYLLMQVQDVTNNIRSLNMKIEQSQAALNVFRDTLVRSIKETDDTSQDNS
jgi:nicotinamide mononucleotide adenylyltransferase